MVSLVLLSILLGCAALLYLKGTLAQGLIMILNALMAGFIALAFFEAVSSILVKYASSLAAWAQTISFLLLFVLVFAALQTVVMQLVKQKIDLGLWPERAGRVVCGLILGYVLTGHLLVAGAMAPLPNSYPYPRFNERNPNASQPDKALLNPDGFVVGLFGTISRGSFAAMSQPKSFAVLHAGFLDALYLNRLKIAKQMPLRTRRSAIEVERRGAWEAPNSLRDSEGKPLPTRPGENLMLVRLGIKRNALQDAGKFTLSQIRLVCRPKGADRQSLGGGGQAVYPVGYIGPDGRLALKPLTEEFTIQPGDVPDTLKNIDFAFYVPADLTPALIAFKGNNLQRVSTLAAGQDVPPPVGFEQSAPSAGQTEEPQSSTGQSDSGSSSSSGRDGTGSGLSNVGQMLTGGALEEDIQP